MELFENYNFNLAKKSILAIFIFYILLALLAPISKVNASSVEWDEVYSNRYGKQFLDLNNIKEIKGDKIQISSKFLKRTKNSEQIFLYTMNIDCNKNLYIDISKNGELIKNPTWEDPNGDKLIDNVINKACCISNK